MRKILISALLIGATAITAAPASAQYGRGDRDRGAYGDRGDRGDRGAYGNRSDDGIDQQIRQIEQRIRQAAQNRTIDRREADRLLRQADQIDRLEDRYSRNGLTGFELRDLRQRVQTLRQQLRFERQDGRDDGRRDRRW
jgi:Spy/CpxP family protein refolding chaperone